MGSGFGEAIEEFGKDVLVPFATRGAVGFDEEGGLAPGLVPEAAFQAVDESLGEVTGRNLQREALAQANLRATEEEASRAQLLKNEQERARRLDIQASGAAASVRGGARGGRAAALRQATLTEDQDFLGL